MILRRRLHGFTLIELLIVMAIIGILAAIAIPNLLTAIQRSRQKRSMADIRSIATAWEARATDLSSYLAAGVASDVVAVPSAFDFSASGLTTLSFATLSGSLSPTYIRQLPQNDGWGFAFAYAADANQYGIRSGGRDESFQGAAYTGGATTDFNCDIVYSNGSFVQYPEGIQK